MSRIRLSHLKYRDFHTCLCEYILCFDTCLPHVKSCQTHIFIRRIDDTKISDRAVLAFSLRVVKINPQLDELP